MTIYVMYYMKYDKLVFAILDTGSSQGKFDSYFVLGWLPSEFFDWGLTWRSQASVKNVLFGLLFKYFHEKGFILLFDSKNFQMALL